MEELQISQIQSLATNTNTALSLNKQSVENATKVGQELIERIEKEGMSEALDQTCNDFLVKCKRTLELMNERRKPVTQLFDQVRKHFTDMENHLDSKGEVYSRIQGARNEFARIKAEEQRKKEEGARKKLEADKEHASVAASIETALFNWLNSYLTESLRSLQEMFNQVTLEKYFDQAQDIAGFEEVYPKEHFDKFDHNVLLVYLTKDDLKAITIKVIDGKFNQFSAQFKEQIHDLKQDLLEKLPSKKEELEKIAEAEKKNAEEAARLKAEREKREKEGRERMEREAAERAKAAGDEADRKKKEGEMDGLFNAAEAMTGEESKVQVKKSWIIEVTHPAAYVQIFQVWFEGEGTKLGTDKLEKVTLGRMKKFCESLASKEGTRIDSKYIVYKEDFKAIAKS